MESRIYSFLCVVRLQAHLPFCKNCRSIRDTCILGQNRLCICKQLCNGYCTWRSTGSISKPQNLVQLLSHGCYAEGFLLTWKKINVTKITDEKVTISDKNQCHKCGKCARVCPMQLSPYENFNENNQFEDINCLKCSTCVAHCPAQILTITNEKNSRFYDEKHKNSCWRKQKKI